MAEEKKKSTGTRRPRKKVTPSEVKVKVIKHYFDIEQQRTMYVDDEFVASKERADYLAEKGFVTRV